MLMTFIATEPGWRCMTNSSLCNVTGIFRPGDAGYNDRCEKRLPRSEWEYEDSFTSSVTEVRHGLRHRLTHFVCMNDLRAGGRARVGWIFRRSLESGLCFSPGEERRLISRTAAGSRALRFIGEARL